MHLVRSTAAALAALTLTLVAAPARAAGTLYDELASFVADVGASALRLQDFDAYEGLPTLLGVELLPESR